MSSAETLNPPAVGANNNTWTEKISSLVNVQDYKGLTDLFNVPLNQVKGVLDTYSKNIDELDKLIADTSSKTKKAYFNFKLNVYKSGSNCHSETCKIESSCTTLTRLCDLFRQGHLSGENFLKSFHGILDIMQNSSKKIEELSATFMNLQKDGTELIEQINSGYKWKIAKRIVFSIAATATAFTLASAGVVGCIVGCLLIFNPTLPLINQLAGVLTVKESAALALTGLAGSIGGITSTGIAVYELVRGGKMYSAIKEEIDITSKDISQTCKGMLDVVKSLNQLNGDLTPQLVGLKSSANKENDLLAVSGALDNILPLCKNVKLSCENLMEKAASIPTITKSSNESSCSIM